MTDSELVDLLRMTKLSKASRDAARLVFVEGIGKTEAADEIGLSKQRMSQIVSVVNKAVLKRDEDLLASHMRHGVVPVNSINIAALDASYAVAVKAARDLHGGDTDIQHPNANSHLSGEVVCQTDFHLVQAVGRGTVVVHELHKLDKVPVVGKNVSIEYNNGRGSVVDRIRSQNRGGITL